MHGSHPTIADVNYRPDIDGLRAISIILVVLGHAFPAYVPGGFVGVDIFFVISGFLITGIIQDDIRNERFNLGAFYARRIRRIFPALIVVLVAVFILGWFTLLPSEFSSLGKQILAGAGFSSNFLMFSEGGYFDAAAQSKPLLHLWSLGIEEQFYLVAPLLLVEISRWKLRLSPALALILICSLAANLIVTQTQPQAAFYLPFTRAWELAAGALLSVNLKTIQLGKIIREIFAWSSLTTLAAVTLLYSSDTPYPGIAAVAPVGAAIALIASEGATANKIVSNKLAVSIGLISYPLYLWHWPVLVFASLLKPSFLRLAEEGGLVGLSFILAWLTYRYVESPIRFGRRWFTNYMLMASMTLTAAGGAAAAVNGFAFRIPEIIRQAGTMTVSREFMRYGECHISASENPTFDKSCTNADTRPVALVWGDSTAGMLAAGFRQIEPAFGLEQLTVNSCPPILVSVRLIDDNCIQTNRKIIQLIEVSKPDIVLLHSLLDERFTVDTIKPTVDALRHAGIVHIVLIGPVPIWRDTLPRLVMQHFRTHHSLIPERSRNVRPYEEQDNRLSEISDKLGIKYISAAKELCNEDGCLTRVGRSSLDLISADVMHLSPAGSRYLALKLAPKIIDSERDYPVESIR